MALLREDGYIKIVGRSKDIIVSAGENIYPREIEETLQKHPGVAEAAVVAKPNKLRSEIPHAFVVLHEQSKESVTESELRDFCRQNLAEFKAPDGITFIDAMPRTAKGTIEKKRVEETGRKTWLMVFYRRL
jgi:fatty-acyl-CoA synthase